MTESNVSSTKIRVSRKKGARTVKRAVCNVSLALAEKIDPGFLARIPSPQTRSTIRNKREVALNWIGPQFLRSYATLEKQVAGLLHSSQRTPGTIDYLGTEEDDVREQEKREALMRTYRIFKATKGKGNDWGLFLTMLTQFETSIQEKYSRPSADVRRRRG